MFLIKWYLMAGVALLVPATLTAQSAAPNLMQSAGPRGTSAGDEMSGANADERAYCTYVTEQALAQRDFLRTPTATSGITQPDNGLPMQFVGGATLGLSDLRKASLTVAAARKNCELYRRTTDTQQDIQYALPSLEQEALHNRLSLIDNATKSLASLLDRTSKMLEAQNATRLMLFSLQTTQIKLNGDRADTQSKISAIYIPPLRDRPLKALVAEKQTSEADEQKSLAKLSRQNNWDVALTVGLHQQLNPLAHGVQPYGEVAVNYNLASHAVNKHLDRSVEAHDAWKAVQEGDVVRSMAELRQQMEASISAQQSKLRTLQEESAEIDKNLQLIGEPDTSAALDFHNQLAAARLLLDVESGDATFRLALLQEYLVKNF
jgi:hypothetical protein